MSESITEYKTDCFAYKRRGNCSALVKMDCKDCSFYTSKDDYFEDMKKYGFIDNDDDM